MFRNRIAVVLGAALVLVSSACSGTEGSSRAATGSGGCPPALTTTGRGTVPAGTGAVTIAPTPVTPVKKQALTPEQLRRRRAAIERVIRNPCTPAPLSGHAAKPKR